MIKKSRELRLPAFFVRPGTLFIVYSIQIFTLFVPVCALKNFFSFTLFKSLLHTFQRVPWGTFSRLLYSINSICSMCLEAPILVYCIQILNFTVPLFDSLFVKNSLFIEYYFQKLNLSVPLWVLRQLLSTIIFKIQNLIHNYNEMTYNIFILKIYFNTKQKVLKLA